MLALHLSCVVRPHVVHADGSLRLRYGTLLDIRVPAAAIASARIERRFSGGRLANIDADGQVDLSVGSQSTVLVELTEPLAFVRPSGRTAQARSFRFHAEDPAAVLAALGSRGVAVRPGGGRRRR
ncbi:hypothetical protein ABH931_002088 [Streptacidiphilus sp. MAP12-33]|uniref:hypothetical protein n=1 Tax=Streptacidiphilus sp. MAP12-33 TaxID=3156266 RepID=UPI003516813C